MTKYVENFSMYGLNILIRDKNTMFKCDTALDMISNEDLYEDIIVETSGYYERGDGGEALYYIDKHNDEFAIVLKNNLYAHLLVDGVIYPEQLGARKGVNMDNAPIINKCAKLVGNGAIMLSGQYFIKSPITFDMTEQRRLTIEGHDSVIVCASDFVGSACIKVTNTNNTWGQSFNLYNAKIQNSSSAECIGIEVSDLGSPLNYNEFTNIEVVDFKNGIKITNSRLVKLDNVSIWDSKFTNGRGIVFSAIGSEKHCGDHIINGGQVSPLSGDGSIAVEFACDDTCTIEGVHFNDFVIYTSKGMFKAQVSGNLIDIWFDRCVFDGYNEKGVEIISTNSRSVYSNISVTNCYFTGITQAFVFNTPNASVRAINFTDNYVNGGGSACVNINPAHGVNVNGNRFIDCQDGESETGIVRLLECISAVANNNNFYLDGERYCKGYMFANGHSCVMVGNVGNNATTTTTYDNTCTNAVKDNNLPV